MHIPVGVGVGWVEMKEMKIYLGGILGRVIFVCISNNVPADLNTSIHVLRKLVFGLLLHLLNSCGWKDRIEGEKQPLSHGQGAGTPG